MFAIGARDPERFCRNFRTAWKRLPPYVRRDLMTHWEIMRKNGHAFYPDCELIPEGFSKAVKFKLGETLGQYGPDSGMKFNASMIDQVSDEETQRTIAHELTHNYQFYLMGDAFRKKDKEEIEFACLMSLNGWGFYGPDDQKRMRNIKNPSEFLKKVVRNRVTASGKNQKDLLKILPENTKKILK